MQIKLLKGQTRCVGGWVWVPPTSAVWAHPSCSCLGLEIKLLGLVSNCKPLNMTVRFQGLIMTPCMSSRAVINLCPRHRNKYRYHHRAAPISRLENSQGHRTLLRQRREISRIAHPALFHPRVGKTLQLEWKFLSCLA